METSVKTNGAIKELREEVKCLFLYKRETIFFKLIKVNTEARERRRSELKEAKLPPIKPRPEAIQPPEEEMKNEVC